MNDFCSLIMFLHPIRLALTKANDRTYLADHRLFKMVNNELPSRKRCLPQEKGSSAAKVCKEKGLSPFIDEKLDQMKKDILTHLGNVGSSSTKNDFHSKLEKMLGYYFKGGKMLRPTVALLMAAACNQEIKGSLEITEDQFKLAMIGEMIHVAGLVHDDVVDEAVIRRGAPSANALWGNKAAILTGDLIFAKTIQLLASIERSDITHLVNKIIQDTIEGEMMQIKSKGDSLEEQVEFDLKRQYKDTASMFESLCRGMAMLSGADEKIQETAAEYGRHFGMSYRLIDCILDCDSEKSEKDLGRDLRQGVITVPVLLAAQKSPELQELITRKSGQRGDIERGLVLIRESGGIEKAMSLAKEHAEQAKELARYFSNDGEIVADLLFLVTMQLERSK